MKLLPIFLLSVFTAFANIPPKKVTVTIKNIKKVKGTIEIGIYDDPSVFLDQGKQLKSISKKVTSNTITFTVELPKDGEYAFAIYQDVNSDKKCNKNFLGIPKEPYGFSNIFKSVFSKPKFKKCKIDTRKNDSLVIKLL